MTLDPDPLYVDEEPWETPAERHDRHVQGYWILAIAAVVAFAVWVMWK